MGARVGTARAAAVAIAAALLLTGCTAGGDDALTADTGRGEAANESVAGDIAEDADGTASQGTVDDAAGRNRAVPALRAEVMTATLTVRVEDVEGAGRRAEDLALGLGGGVSASQTLVDPGTPEQTSAVLTLRVPNEELVGFLRTLSGLGTRLDESRTTEDVTAEVADVESRVGNQRASIARLREFLGSTESIEDVVRVEAELTRRESELEALQARSRALMDRTTLATVTLTLFGPEGTAAADDEDLGFLAGLRGGWDAFVTASMVALTVFGALLPFGVLLGLVGLPALLLLRNRGRRARTADSAPVP